MNAIQARKIALSRKKNCDEIQKYHKVISEAAAQGELLVRVDEYIHPDIQKCLRKEGYEVSHETWRNETVTTIKW